MKKFVLNALAALRKRRKADVPTESHSQNAIDSLLRKVKKIEVFSNRVANEMTSGQYKSAFRGQGVEFDEVREYAEGDDVRTIDWNVTARSNKPYVKRFSEERERSLLFILDISASNLFGSQTSKIETATEIVASMMFSALKNNDKVGLLTFADGVRSYFPPKKGRNHVLRLIREMLSIRPLRERTDLDKALEFVNKTLKRRAVVFIVSDFYVSNLSENLALCKRKHDVIAISVDEPTEKAFPNFGFVALRDPETDEIVELDAGSSRARLEVVEALRQRRDKVAQTLKKARVDLIAVVNGGDYVQPLRAFFRRRRRR